MRLQDGHARSEALSWVESHGEEIDKTRNQLDELEHKLVQDEADLEQVRDSLKGQLFRPVFPLRTRLRIFSWIIDKTDEFTTKIEQKQLELEPWTAKVSEKQGAMDVALSEKSALEARATAGQQAWTDAVARLESLTEGLSAKVRPYPVCNMEMLIFATSFQREEHARLTKEKAELDKKLAVGEKNLAVSRLSLRSMCCLLTFESRRTCRPMQTLFGPK